MHNVFLFGSYFWNACGDFTKQIKSPDIDFSCLTNKWPVKKGGKFKANLWLSILKTGAYHWMEKSTAYPLPSNLAHSWIMARYERAWAHHRIKGCFCMFVCVFACLFLCACFHLSINASKPPKSRWIAIVKNRHREQAWILARSCMRVHVCAPLWKEMLP